MILIETVNGYNILVWYVMQSLGFTIRIVFPFIFFKPNSKIKKFIAYGLIIIYQILLMTTDYFRYYAFIFW